MQTITGNTYPVKEALKALGGRWNDGKKGWDVPDDKADQARALVASAPVSKRRPFSGARSYSERRFNCEDCGDTVMSGTRCWETGLTH